MDKMLDTIDSVKNWPINCIRKDPKTFRTPTSLARPADRAVERLMKLMQAIITINRAMAEKI